MTTYSFDPTYGYTQETLLKVGSPHPPAEYETYWKSTYAQTLAIPPAPTVRQISSPADSFDLFELEYTSLDNFRVGGWLTLPRNKPPLALAVVGHGYGGREAVDSFLSSHAIAAIYPCGRGFHRSARPDYPNQGATHVLHGIEHRETYSHRGCVADMWTAATILLDRYPSLPLSYYGQSFGGGIGAMTVPWDDRFSRAYLDIPSFGNHPIRLTCPCVGSGESVRLRYQQDPSILTTLAFFDGATAARFIEIPTFVSPALYDPAVPPPGQFAIYNAIPARKELFIRQAAHCESPSGPAEDAALRTLTARFLEWTN